MATLENGYKHSLQFFASRKNRDLQLVSTDKQLFLRNSNLNVIPYAYAFLDNIVILSEGAEIKHITTVEKSHQLQHLENMALNLLKSKIGKLDNHPHPVSSVNNRL